MRDIFRVMTKEVHRERIRVPIDPRVIRVRLGYYVLSKIYGKKEKRYKTVFPGLHPVLVTLNWTGLNE